MNNKFSIAKLVTITLGTFCVVFIYLIWSDLSDIGEIQKSAINGTTEAAANVKSSLTDAKKKSILKLSEFNEIVKRPLFNSDRLPIVNSSSVSNKKSGNKSKKPGQYLLSAVIITADKRIAIIQTGKNKNHHKVSLGESIDDWVLSDVSHHSIRLSKGGLSKSLELEIKKSDRKQSANNKKKTRAKPTEP